MSNEILITLIIGVLIMLILHYLARKKNIKAFKILLWVFGAIWFFNIWLYRITINYWIILFVMPIVFIVIIWAKINELNPSANKIKNDLGTDNVTEYKGKLPKWIGGFMLPFAPFFYVKNKKWEQHESEVEIHEQQHISLLLNKGWIFLFLLMVVMVGIFSSIMENFKVAKPIITILTSTIMTVFLVLFEKVTIDETRKYAEKNNISVRGKRKGLYFKYFYYYFIQVLILSMFFQLLYRWL